MKTVTQTKIIALIGVATSLLILSLNDWSFVSLMHKSLFWLFVYMLFVTFTGICFAFGFFHRYNFQPFKKWLMPAAVVVYVTPALISTIFTYDSRCVVIIAFHLAALIVGIRVLAWRQKTIEKKKANTVQNDDETKRE